MAEHPAFFSHLATGLRKTREAFFDRIVRLLQRSHVDQYLLEELEEILITADLGMPTVQRLLDALPPTVANPDELLHVLKQQVTSILSVSQGNIPEGQPHVVLTLGVNGVGKTTTIGKLAFRATREGKRVLLAGADTFRAAAIEQLQIWGEKAGAEVIAHQRGGDPAAVVFDALQAAQARGVDLLLIDTAGRLHTKKNLLEELKKIHRVAARNLPGAPHESLLMLDATTGLNAALQAREFHKAIGITGLIITKLDGTAKGGAVVGIVAELQIPVRYVGLGEGLEDLEPFSPPAFAEALFSRGPEPNRVSPRAN
ncbi:MAG: signal recognition particle-docking protein FtsY [candidate division NC10 bacterium]|jgi:fused signal recognition particle receptor|nr:signal recognition particle-docking protein FtsY [candidate division NC10 bacterium]MCH7895517.1 signal recognition particle-docking protein FtsY [candidate division NC10 bacterium]MCZ6551865.1 signal recognition particle-docking protein FtsY [candidate division NC10 bacterium]